MVSRRRTAPAVLLFLLLPAGPGNSRESGEEVVVTATRLGSAEGVWRDRLRVIEREELAAWAGSTLADLLARASLLDVRRRGAGQADLSLRGSGFEQVLVLLDGVPVNDPQTGHHNLDLPLTLDDIERVEILPGVGSAVYGPGAYSGVVNIITCTGVSAGSVFRAAGGSNSTHASSLSLAAGSAAYAGRLSAGLERTAGHRPGVESESLILSFGAQLVHPGGSTRLRVGYLDRRFGADSFYGPYPSREATGTLLLYLSSFLGDPARLEILPRLSYRRHSDDFLLDRNQPAGFRSEHRTGTLGMEISFRLAKTALGSLALGFEHGEQEIESSTLGDRRRRRFGVFVEDGISLLAGLRLNAGLRADWGLEEGRRRFAYLSPALSLRADLLEGWTLLASAGRGFRLPSFTELYYHSPANQGDPALSAEESWAGDLTVVCRPRTGITVSAGGFVKRDTNLVDWIKDSDGDPWRAANLGTITSAGAEIRLVATPAPGTTLEVAYARLALSRQSPARYSKYVFRQPVDDLLLRARGPLWWGLEGAVSLRLRNRPGQEGALQVDARLRRAWGPLEVFLEAANILAAREEELPGVPLPGLTVQAGLSLARR